MRAAPQHAAPLLRRLLRDEGGGITVEFVATLPMLLGVMALVFELGRGLWYHHVVTKGVRDATRYAARYPTLGVPCSDLAGEAAFLDRVRRVALTGDSAGTRTAAFWTDPGTVTVTMSVSALVLRMPGTCTVTVRAEVPHRLAMFEVFSAFWEFDPAITITVQDQARHVGD